MKNFPLINFLCMGASSNLLAYLTKHCFKIEFKQILRIKFNFICLRFDKKPFKFKFHISEDCEKQGEYQAPCWRVSKIFPTHSLIGTIHQ